MSALPPDPGQADREVLEAFVAAGHSPVTYDARAGRRVGETTWTEDGRDGRSMLGREHVGPCCEACDRVDEIPNATGQTASRDGSPRPATPWAARCSGRTWPPSRQSAGRAESRSGPTRKSRRRPRSSRTWIVLTLVALAGPALGETIPVRPGFYPRADRPCATRGDAAAYDRLLHVDDDGVSDSAHARTVVHVREENGAIVVDQWSRDLRNGGEKASLSGVVRIMDPQEFVLLEADDGVDWGGQWRWCGDAIP